MFYIKRKNYAGRWVVRVIQAALIFGIVFYGLAVFDKMIEPRFEDTVVVVESVQPEVQVITIESNSQPELDEVDYFYLGLEHQMSGEYYDAIADYSRSIELDSDLAASFLNRGVAYEQMGNNEYRAISDFTQWMMRDNMVVISRVALDNSTNFSVTMSANYRYDVPLDLNRGELISLSVVSLNEDEVDPIIVLLDSNGNPVAANDDVRRQGGSLASMNSYINNYEVLRSGEYTLMVSHAGGGSYGDVVVRISIDH